MNLDCGIAPPRTPRISRRQGESEPWAGGLRRGVGRGVVRGDEHHQRAQVAVRGVLPLDAGESEKLGLGFLRVKG